MKPKSYRWVWWETGRLFDIGILADGSLHNPNGYPESDVRAAIQEAQERPCLPWGEWRARRSQKVSVQGVTNGLNVPLMREQAQAKKKEIKLQRALAFQLIDIGCYRTLATRLHPDKGRIARSHDALEPSPHFTLCCAINPYSTG
jgi:hypothetical protein